MKEEGKNIVEAIAVVDIDPNLLPFMSQQQKWLTSIQIVTEVVRERSNQKYFRILPGIFILLTYCQKNKDPIYQIQFNLKPEYQWNVVKMQENIQGLIGAFLCFKTESNGNSGPICDIDILNVERKNRFGQSKEILNIPHSYKLISHQLPFGYLIYRKAILSQKYLSNGAERINLTQLPLFCFPEGIKIVRQIRGFLTFNFLFTLETAQRIYITCLIFKEFLDQAKKQKLEVGAHQQLFYQKALCIISNRCFSDQFGECLQHLYRLSMSKSQIPFWKIIKYFVSEMVLPSRDDVGLSYFYAGNRINFPTSKLYPIVSQRAIYSIFKFLRVQNIISVFQSLLLQRKVFFVSQSKTILGYATQAFLGLLYPFKWQQVLIPILPSTLKELISAPVPIVVGIVPALVDTSIQTDSVIVYLDKNQVLNDEDNPPLPQKMLKQLIKRLEKMEIYDPDEVAQFLQNPQSTYLFKMQQVQDPNFHGYIIRDIFYQFILTLMKNYKKFMVKIKEDFKNYQDNTLINLNQPVIMSNMFKIQDFLNDLGMTKVGSFGYKFTQSSIFTSFIQRKFQYPNDPSLIYFDECIERKKNKKQSSLIIQLTNKQYITMKNPQIDIQDNGPFFYNKFPSLLKDPQLKYQQIILKISDKNEEQQNILILKIQQQYQLNCQLFQCYQNQDILIKKMMSLLLNKNKLKLCYKDISNKISVVKQFFYIYTLQIKQIQFIFNQWPTIICQQKFISVNKYQYIKQDKKVDQNCIIGVQQGMDYQVLIRNNTKILFTNSRVRSSTVHKSSSLITIQVLNTRIKTFLNKILKNQAGYLIDYCQKQMLKEIKGSSIKKQNQQCWNIENIILFKNWMNYQKQFGTGATID